MKRFNPAALPCPVVLVTGHYGVGKTNFSLNMAIDAAAAGREVTLIDLDVVNPYFRSSDYTELLERAGVRMIAPILAGTTLDTPSLSGAIDVAIQDAYARGAACASGGPCDGSCAPDPHTPLVILDVGGDDVGSRALARFSDLIATGSYEMLYVVNRYRNLSARPDQALEYLKEIQDTARLQATGVVANSHLMQAGDEHTILDALPFVYEVCEAAHLPLVCVTVPKGVAKASTEASAEANTKASTEASAGASTEASAEATIKANTKDSIFLKHDAQFAIESKDYLYPIEVYVRTPWEV